MKEIDSFEFSIENNVSEEKIIDFLSELLQINKDKFWNWDWDGDSKSEIAINISIETGTKSFTIKNEKGLPVPSDQLKSNTFSEENMEDQNNQFIALLFNDAKTVSNLFELNIGQS